MTPTEKLAKNIEIAKQQEKVDALKVITDAAIKYNSDNKDMLINDLLRANVKLEEMIKGN